MGHPVLGLRGSRCLSRVNNMSVAIGSLLTISGAAFATVPDGIRARKIGAKLLWCGPEIVHRTRLVGKDRSVWNQDRVNTNSLARVW
jgi:hypothetical protein